MDGNIYVCLSLGDCLLSQSSLQGVGTTLSGSIKPFFGMSQTVSFADEPGKKGIQVFVMDKPKYPGHEETIKKQIRAILTSNLKTVEDQEIDIRINYAQFNPNFRPLQSAEVRGMNEKDGDKKAAVGQENEKKGKGGDEFDYEKLSMNYCAEEPRYSFDQVILPEKTLEQIERAIGIIEVEHKVFDEWGLRSIIPTASSALSFYGPPGTGKSMAAEAIAQKLGRKILSATYADIESKYHGEGPKMVKAIFRAAERDNAVLFLDESDSLLSKRLTNVSDGSAQAINSMRSQLLISLEHFKGIVIFATNLVVNYDKAFLSRLINIEFVMPTPSEREKIWWQHLRTDTVHVPLDPDVDITYLAQAFEFCGREIKSAVKSACIAAALEKRETVTQSDFIKACEITKEETLRVTTANDYTVSKTSLSGEKKDALIDAMQKKLDAGAQ